ncbi:MAG: transposase [Patescibacteria group bacterium]
MRHKNSPKRYYVPEAIYFIAIVTYRRWPYFNRGWLRDLFIEEIIIMKRLKKFQLFEFVIMPDHVHLLIKPNNEYNISQIIHSLKKGFSRDVNNLLVGAVHEPRLRGWQYSHRFKKYFLVINSNKYHKYFQNEPFTKRFKWQKSFYDHIIRNENDYFNHVNYIHINPQKHGLMNDWRSYPYSSYNKDYRYLTDNPSF